MPCLGEVWIDQIRNIKDLENSRYIERVVSASKEREKQAEEEVNILIDKWIKKGIAQCIERGNSVYGIGTYKFIIGTEAFGRLMDWAEQQKLGVFFDDSEHVTPRGEKTDFDLLFVPKQQLAQIQSSA